MNIYGIGWILAALPAVAGSAPSDCPGKMVDGVLIVSHSGRPATLSTFSVTWVMLKGRTSEMIMEEFYLPFMVEDQFIPAANSICKVKYHTAVTSGGTREGPIPTERNLKIVDEILCDTGTFIMKW